MNQKIESADAPKAFGPYSQAVKSGNLVFLSGQLGMDPKTGQMAEGVENQARQALNNLKAVLKEAGCEFANVARAEIFLINMDDFSKVNAIYEEFFTSDPKPARQTVGVAALPKNGLVEISLIAVCP